MDISAGTLASTTPLVSRNIDEPTVVAHLMRLGFTASIASKTVKAVKNLAESYGAVQKKDWIKLSEKLPAGVGNIADAAKLSTAGLVAGEFAKTMALTKALTMSPARAGIFLSAAIFDKGIKAAGIADIKEFDECSKATASLVADLLMAGFSIGTLGPFGLGLTIASIGFSTVDIRNKCFASSPSDATAVH